MSYLSCAQLRYTWAERRLDGRGAGFGVIVRSHDWPLDLLEDPQVKELLTDLSPAARREPAEVSHALVAHRRVRGGSLLVAKRSVGTDGAGRPGNFAIHALFDPTATVGALDLHTLVAGGTFRLERDVDVVPDDEAEPVSVWAAPDWRTGTGPWGPQRSRRAGLHGPYGDRPLSYRKIADLDTLLSTLTQQLPADLVNQLELDGSPSAEPGRDSDPETVVPGEIDELIIQCRAAVKLGAVDRDLWWERRSGSPADWRRELDDFVVMNQPVHRVPDDQLWDRWDRATERGQALIAVELLSRPALAEDETGVAEVRRRPHLLNELMEVGVRGSAADRSAAARWVAAAGDDDQVLDLAAELLATDAGVPAPLLNRLQLRSPDDLPTPVVRVVAENLDGAAPLAPPWRARCLQLFLTGQPTCAHADQLVQASSEQDLVEAVRATVVDGDSAAASWQRLSEVLSGSRLAGVFATANAVGAEFVLRQALPVRRQAPALFVDLWTGLATTLGWADWPTVVVSRIDRDNRTLRRQRNLLLIAAAVLIMAVAVLAVLLAVHTAA